MYLLVLFTPLMNFIFSMFFGRFIGKNGVILICILGMIISFLGSILVFYEVSLRGSVCIIYLYKWINVS